MAFVPYKERVEYQLNDVPPTIMRRLRREAERRQVSVPNLVGTILSERCGSPFTPSRRTNVTGDRPYLYLRLPAELMDCVKQEARETRVTLRSVMLFALADHFGLKRPEPTLVTGGWPGRRKEQ